MESVELSKYLASLRRRVWLVMAGILIAGGTALLVSRAKPPIYEAQAGIVIVRSKEEVAFTPTMRTLSEEELLGAAIIQSRGDALKALVKTSTVATRVISDIGDLLDQGQRKANVLLDMVNIESEGDFITIKVRDTDPTRAAALANSWAAQYEEYVNGLYGEASQPSGNIGVQLAEAASNYRNAEEALAQFLGNNEIDRLEGEIEIRKNILADYYDTKQRLERLIADAEALRAELQEGTSAPSTSTSAGNNLAILLLRASAFTMSAGLPVDLQLAVEQMWETEGEPSSQQEGLDSLIETLKQRRVDIDSLLSEASLQKEILALEEQLERESAKQQELVATRDLSWETYSTLSRKAAEVEIAAEAGSTQVRFAMPAIAPDRPVSQHRLLTTLLASVVGAMLTIGAVLAAEYVDQSITTPEDVTQTTGLPTLGSILTFEAKGITQPVTLEAPLSPTAESFRVLRTRLEAAMPETPTCFLIASPTPMEGKSTIAANLGVVFAEANSSVILVDSDLRRPVLHTVFGVPNDKGLSDILLEDHLDLDQHLRETGVKNLRLLTSGSTSLNPSESLGSTRVGALVQELKSKADVILFDSPAILTVTDADVLSKHTDGVLLVVESGKTERENARIASERLAAVGAKILGVVLNKVRPSKVSFYYHQGESRHQARKTTLHS